MHFGWGKYIFKILLMITIIGIPFGAFLNYITHHELPITTIYVAYGIAAFLLGLISCIIIRKSTDNSKQLASAGIIIPDHLFCTLKAEAQYKMNLKNNTALH